MTLLLVFTERNRLSTLSSTSEMEMNAREKNPAKGPEVNSGKDVECGGCSGPTKRM